MKMNKTLISVFVLVALFSVEALAQRDRPSSGRTSSRTGDSSSSSGSSSSTVGSGGGWSSGSSSSSGGWSSGGSSSSSSSDWDSGSYGSGGYYDYGAEYVNRARERQMGRNTAPILQHRIDQQWGSPITSGNVSAMHSYHSGNYRVHHHHPYSHFNNCHSGHYYGHSRDYYVGVHHGYIYQSWVFEPAPFYYDSGYNCIDGYPYYVDEGYRYRYSDVDYCNYDLVDLKNNKTVKAFHQIVCNKAFDTCAAKRDQLNQDEDVQRYVCVEKVDEDLVNSDLDEIPGMVNNLTDEEIFELSSFVSAKAPQELFKLGKNKGVGKCRIKKLKRTKNEYGCNYRVEVDGKPYPMTDGSVCSNSKRTKLEYYGCKSGSQMKNASCLLSLAILEGYCQE